MVDNHQHQWREKHYKVTCEEKPKLNEWKTGTKSKVKERTIIFRLINVVTTQGSDDISPEKPLAFPPSFFFPRLDHYPWLTLKICLLILLPFFFFPRHGLRLLSLTRLVQSYKVDEIVHKKRTPEDGRSTQVYFFHISYDICTRITCRMKTLVWYVTIPTVCRSDYRSKIQYCAAKSMNSTQKKKL